MKFDVNRLSRLAGISDGDGEKRALTESGNRSMHDDPGNKPESEHRFGKGQLNEEEGEYDPLAYLSELDDESGETTEGDYEGVEEDVMLEIDENMLRTEIMKMKKERLEETSLRRAIRNEIQDIFQSLNSDSSWVYGNNKPTNSKEGQVNMGFPGIGF